MNWSDFGNKLTARSGILELMDDLGQAMQAPGKKYMLGGGNPAAIPEVNAIWRRRMEEILADGDAFEKGLANYDTPQGKQVFLEALAALLNREFHWGLTGENIAVTNGSQSAFFMIFNLFSGAIDESRGQGIGIQHASGHRKILLPLNPEYIGYADQGIGESHFVSLPPIIKRIGEDRFKYHIDFEAVDGLLRESSQDIAAICVSRPTNPTGNVLTDGEMERLDRIAREHKVPLIIDSAYGTPFPDIIFTEAAPLWNDNIILGMSLSKIGLPSTRTGIIVARREVIQAVSAVNAIVSLSNGTLGQLLTAPLVESGEIIDISRRLVRPFYQRKSDKAVAAIRKHCQGLPYRIHVSEGALFLWLWFEDSGIDTFDLYRRLKERNTIIVPGKYFFFGSTAGDDSHRNHARECIRISFAQEDEDVEEGIRRIAEEAAVLMGRPYQA